MLMTVWYWYVVGTAGSVGAVVGSGVGVGGDIVGAVARRDPAVARD